MTLDERWFAGRLVPLSREECLEAVAQRPVGRVAYQDPDGPVVIPVNYVLDGDDVLFRIRSWSEMARGLRGAVSFQVDDLDEFHRSGWSVLLRGSVFFVDHDGGLSRAGDETPRPEPWAEGNRELLVRLSPDHISGRRLMPV